MKKIKTMQFLKKNKWLFFLLIFPLFFFYLDSLCISTIKTIYKNFPNINRLMDYPDKFVNVLSNGLTLLTVASLIYIFGLLMKRIKLTEIGKTLFIGFWLTGISIQIFKHLIGRARPKMSDSFLCIGPNFKSGFDSFPSGHTAIAFCFSAILSSFLPQYRVIFYLIALIIGFERIEDFSHFPSDVIAGAIIGLIIGKILIKYINKEKLSLTLKNKKYLIRNNRVPS